MTAECGGLTALLGRWPRGAVFWLRAEQPRRVVDRDHLNRLGLDAIDDAIGPVDDFAEIVVTDFGNNAARLWVTQGDRRPPRSFGEQRA